MDLKPQGIKVNNNAKLLQAAMECPQSVNIEVKGQLTCDSPGSELVRNAAHSGWMFHSPSSKSRNAIFAATDLFIRKVCGISEKMYSVSDSMGEVVKKTFPLLAGASLLAGAGLNIIVSDNGSYLLCQRQYSYLFLWD